MARSSPHPRGVALVTGGSRGIGREIALRLAAEGYAVGVNYLSARDQADDVVRACQDFGQEAIALRADVSQIDEASALVHESESRLGPLSVLVNNAGMTRDSLVMRLSESDWDATWSTNLAGTRAAARTALKCMSTRKTGRIVNVSSVVGCTGNAGQANYAAAKAAILGLTQELACVAASQGVSVNCVVPGYILTDATAHLTQAQTEGWMKRIPMGRSATPEEVVQTVWFLIQQSGYVTGQCIAVDGGLLAAAGLGIAY